jgi:hypothetical protein
MERPLGGAQTGAAFEVLRNRVQQLLDTGCRLVSPPLEFRRTRRSVFGTLAGECAHFPVECAGSVSPCGHHRSLHRRRHIE